MVPPKAMLSMGIMVVGMVVRLVKETAVILKELDSPKDRKAVDDDIEAAIARAKSGKADDDIEAAIARAKSGKATGGKKKTAAGKNMFCSNCGKPMDSNDKFCTKCGHKK